MPGQYPKRPPFFAFRFCRLMAKVCLANEVGADACWLLAVVANTEDAKSYRGAVTYFNDQLLPLVGVRSEDALARVRGKAVAAGWLHYEPGRKGVAGRYWVLIPNDYAGMDDAPTDENASEYSPDDPAKVRGKAGGKPGESAGTTAGKAGGKPGESADHSSLFLSCPVPEEVCPETARPPSSGPAAVLTYPTDGPVRHWPLTDAKLAEYRESYPSLDVLGECRKALQWLRDNPAKRKTATGMPAYLGRWLAKCQNRDPPATADDRRRHTHTRSSPDDRPDAGAGRASDFG